MSVRSYVKAKKYFGGSILAVEMDNGDFLQIYNAYEIDKNPGDYEKACEQKILSRDKCKKIGFIGELQSYRRLGLDQHIRLSNKDSFYLRRMIEKEENIYYGEY